MMDIVLSDDTVFPPYHFHFSDGTTTAGSDVHYFRIIDEDEPDWWADEEPQPWREASENEKKMLKIAGRLSHEKRQNPEKRRKRRDNYTTQRASTRQRMM